MNEPKPLTKEEREDLRSVLLLLDERYRFASEVLQKLSSAETYWREVVRKLSPNIPEGGTTLVMCQLCSAKTFESHTPDCPWRLAQESK